jgi:hypothetical protein
VAQTVCHTIMEYLMIVMGRCVIHHRIWCTHPHIRGRRTQERSDLPLCACAGRLLGRIDEISSGLWSWEGPAGAGAAGLPAAIALASCKNIGRGSAALDLCGESLQISYWPCTRRTSEAFP